MEKQTKKRTFQPNRYCHNCLHNWGSVCERDGHKVAQYVSIHAPVKGRLTINRFLFLAVEFQSTPR